MPSVLDMSKEDTSDWAFKNSPLLYLGVDGFGLKIAGLNLNGFKGQARIEKQLAPMNGKDLCLTFSFRLGCYESAIACIEE